MAEKMDVLRERNKKLLEQIEELKIKIENNEQLNTASYVKAKELIGDLEYLKSEWITQINVLLELQDEYRELLKPLRNFKTSLAEMFKKI